MSLPGVNRDSPEMLSGKFRTSWTQPEGMVPAYIVECTVADLNLKLWTVDAVSKYDQHFYPNVQVGSPYMHYDSGEGIYVMPDIGAKCHVCIPSDGPPPFVLDFIMPQESIPQVDTTDGTGGDGDTASFTFGGGRVRPKPGDIYIRGRNENFVILHRGGVLQIGATELAQRIYIPLQNLITDISENYRHYNTGGSINWFLAKGESETNPPTILKETYRLLAADKKASIRIAVGKLRDFVPEPKDGANSDLNQLDIGISEPIVCEVVLAPDGFGADNGSSDSSTINATKLRYFFDKAGGAFLRSESSVLLFIREKLRLVVKNDINISTAKSFTLTAKKTGRVDGGDLLEITGKVTKINGGSKSVAHVGSLVDITIPLQGLATTPAALGVPSIILPIHPITGLPQKLAGVVVTGNATILV